MKSLEEIANSIVKIEGDKREASPDYNRTKIGSIFEYIGKLDGLELGTKEGLDAYKDLTGDDPSKYTSAEADLNKRRFSSLLNTYLTDYVRRHLGSAVSDLGESERVNLAFSNVPLTDLEGNKGYSNTRDILRRAKEKIDLITNNPEAYFAIQSQNLPDILKPALFYHQDEALRIGRALASETGQIAITRYGSGQFLMDTYKHVNVLGDEREKLEKQFAKEQEEFRTRFMKEHAGSVTDPVDPGKSLPNAYHEAEFLNGSKTFKRLAIVTEDLKLSGKIVSGIAQLIARNYFQEKALKEAKAKRSA